MNPADMSITTELRRARLYMLLQEHQQFDVFNVWELYTKAYPDDFVPHQALWDELDVLERAGQLWSDFAPGVCTFRLGTRPQ